MEEIVHVTSVDQITRNLLNAGPQHPLITIMDFSQVELCGATRVRFTSDLYMILLKNNCDSDVKYGRQNYDFKDGMLSFFSPNQVVLIEPNYNPNEPDSGFGLFFHPDFIAKTALAKKMKTYSFFGYSVSEALHTSDKEKMTLLQCLENIEQEISNNIDKHSEELVVSNLGLFLNYCTRFLKGNF